MLQPRELSLALASAALLTVAAPAVAQVPQDTLPQDTLAADTTGGVPADTADTLSVFPRFPLAGDDALGTDRFWSHRDLLGGAALTVADLLEHEPFLTSIRAGFLEGPHALVFAGSGPSGLRLDVDGYVMAPIGGGAVDSHMLSLVEAQRAALRRTPGGYDLTIDTYRRGRPEPYSRIEGGTGDLDTNLLRGFFASELVGTELAFGFDRVDTRGTAELMAAERTTVWTSLARRLPADLWGQLEMRRSLIARQSFESPDRADLILRLRRPFGAGWTGDLVAGVARRSQERVTEPTPENPQGATEEVETSARQLAVRAGRTGANYRATASLRLWGADGFPNLESEGRVELGAEPIRLFLTGEYADWGSFGAAAGLARARLRLPLGFRAILEAESGERGLVGSVPVSEYSFDGWTAGLEFRRWDWTLGVRGGTWRVGPSPGLGAPYDSASVVSGGRVDLFEAYGRGRILTLFEGPLEIGGRFRGRQQGPLIYWPLDEWRIEGSYRTLLLEEQLEIGLRGVGGVRGQMRVPDPASLNVIVTENLRWFSGEVLIRVKDVWVFFTYEAFDSLTGAQDAPGFPLPLARTHFGLKWEFWN